MKKTKIIILLYILKNTQNKFNIKLLILFKYLRISYTGVIYNPKEIDFSSSRSQINIWYITDYMLFMICR